MNAQFELLLDTLSQPNKLQAPRKLLAALKACPEIPSLPEPQESSLTLALAQATGRYGLRTTNHAKTISAEGLLGIAQDIRFQTANRRAP